MFWPNFFSITFIWLHKQRHIFGFWNLVLFLTYLVVDLSIFGESHTYDLFMIRSQSIFKIFTKFFSSVILRWLLFTKKICNNEIDQYLVRKNFLKFFCWCICIFLDIIQIFEIFYLWTNFFQTFHKVLLMFDEPNAPILRIVA